MRCLSLRHSAGDKHLPYSPEPNLSSVLFILRQHCLGVLTTHTNRGEERGVNVEALRNVFFIKVTQDDLSVMTPMKTGIFCHRNFCIQRLTGPKAISSRVLQNHSYTKISMHNRVSLEISYDAFQRGSVYISIYCHTMRK